MSHPEGPDLTEYQNFSVEKTNQPIAEKLVSAQEVLKKTAANVESLTNLSAIVNNVAKKGSEQVVKVLKLIFSK